MSKMHNNKISRRNSLCDKWDSNRGTVMFVIKLFKNENVGLMFFHKV